MIIKAVTFDCANTLLQVDWKLGSFALDCARHAGLDLNEAAADLYASMYDRRHGEYLELNLTKDHKRCAGFWHRLGKDWLRELGIPEERQAKLEAASRELGFGPDSKVFRLYDDVLPCLERLRSQGLKTAVISNWDYTLHHVLQSAGVYDKFDCVIASLEEGFEKPDARIFRLALDQLCLKPGECAHVGDDPLDDYQGATAAGMKAILIDRKNESPKPPYISSLERLPEALAWSA